MELGNQVSWKSYGGQARGADGGRRDSPRGGGTGHVSAFL